MALIRKTLALLAWLIIEIPTTLFVAFVMVKVFVEGRAKEGKNARRQQREHSA